MMSALREEIRTILREELASVIEARMLPDIQRIKIENSHDLNAFARLILEKMSNPKFAEQLNSGQVMFELDDQATTYRKMHTIPASVAKPTQKSVPTINKNLITEADIANVSAGNVLVPRSARITPLAKDEAKRKGVRIERTDS
jgi:hypothetical protein